LPSQIVDEKDPRRDGAWGVYAHPFGYGAILDVFAAVLHSLTDFHEHIVTAVGDTVSINLHFDTDTPAVTVRSKRGAKATLTITAQRRCGLRVRIPQWAPRESLQVKIAGAPRPVRWEDGYLSIPSAELPARSVVEVQHDLPAHQTVEEMPVSHRRFQLNWRGDEVVSCDPKVPIYPGATG
jgi:hypothetical protein